MDTEVVLQFKTETITKNLEEYSRRESTQCIVSFGSMVWIALELCSAASLLPKIANHQG